MRGGFKRGDGGGSGGEARERQETGVKGGGQKWGGRHFREEEEDGRL